MSFGNTLARLRRDRGWSQEALALRAGLSQRHISFLETGRARPGEASLRKLIAALALRGWEQRHLLAALVPYADEAITVAYDPSFIERVAETLSPWPTYVFQPDGTLSFANSALHRLLSHASPREDLLHATAPAKGPNIYDLALHPAGLLRWMINPEEVVPETLRRLRIEAATDPRLAPVLGRLEAYPAAVTFASVPAMPPSVLIERYAIDRSIFSVVSIISHLASPGEVELATLRIETFMPADEISASIMNGL
jgi:transcriptional regulator with XRE-family HTH domain